MLKNKIKTLLVIALSAGAFWACTEQWDDHYTKAVDNKGDDLYTTLSKNANLSKFLRMVEICGLTEQFAGGEALTVWAPSNDALIAVNVENMTAEDSAQIQQIVFNHIARYNYSTSDTELSADGKRVFMYNKKWAAFQKQGENYLFGTVPLDLKNIVCSNGVLHSLNGIAPFQHNLWELIQFDPELIDSKTLLQRYDTLIFDHERSRKLGIGSDGRTIYDSVTIFRNKMLERLGVIYDEDSLFSCVLPTQAAYQATYNQYAQYFKSNGGIDGKGNKTKIQKERTDSAIFNNLIFRGNYWELGSDSVVNSAKIAFYNPNELFNAPWQQQSNGWAMITNDLKMDIKQTYYKPILLRPSYLGFPKGYELANGGQVEKLYKNPLIPFEGVTGSYFKMIAGEPTKDPALCIYFGNKLLSAKYDVYVTIIPSSIELGKDSTILDFGWVYHSGTSVVQIGNPSKAGFVQGYVTKSNVLEEKLVCSNLNVATFDCNGGLVITVRVPAAQATQYSKIVRIGNVRLVPSE
jgi:uncharacterized surface protein with fasciclin (FAS1) repeats